MGSEIFGFKDADESQYILQVPDPNTPLYIYILKSHKGKNIWDFLKQFVSQIGIGYLGRLWVLGPLMNVEVGIKKSKSDEDKDEDGDINK